jgi:hypothetical protein
MLDRAVSGIVGVFEKEGVCDLTHSFATTGSKVLPRFTRIE